MNNATARHEPKCLLLAGAIALGASAAFADPPTYSLELIDLMGDDYSNTAMAINNAGQVAGYSNAPDGNHSWRFTNGVLEDIGDLGGIVMRAQSMNELGHVAGYGNLNNGNWVGWVWDGQSIETIPTFGGPGSRGWGINDLGETVGDAQVASTGEWNALLWTGGAPENLGTLGGGNSLAYDINNSSQICGFATNAAIQARAVIWHLGEIHELQQPSPHTNSVAYGINEDAVACGSVGDGWDIMLPAMWDGAGVHILPEISGVGPTSYPYKINETGTIVGWTQFWGGGAVATLWMDGEVYDLNDLVDTPLDISLAKAWDVNDDGVIVGFGILDDNLRAVILTPQAGNPADINGDGVVDVLDLLAILAAWGNAGGPEDVNGDGIVDVLDLLAVLAAWGPA